MFLKRALLLGLIAAALIGLLAYSQLREESLKVSGFIEADEIRVGSRVGGRVAEVLIEEGSAVRRDQELVRLEPYDLKQLQAESTSKLAASQAELDRLTAGYQVEEVQQAEARYQQVAARLEMLTNGPRQEEINAARGRSDAAEVELVLATRNMDRSRQLLRDNAIARQEFETTEEQQKSAQAAVVVRHNELQLLLSGTRPEELNEARARLAEAKAAWDLLRQGYRSEVIAQATAARDAAGAQLAAIEQRLHELVIRSPVDGVVEAFDLQPGDLVGPGAPVLSLINNERLWVRAYVPENHLDLRVGQLLWLSVDSFPAERFAGKLSFIARRAEFTPSNVQTPEERSKQVFRVKVLITEGLDHLRPGMSADVWLEEPRQTQSGVNGGATGHNAPVEKVVNKDFHKDVIDD